jgi:hypothetical protein
MRKTLGLSLAALLALALGGCGESTTTNALTVPDNTVTCTTTLPSGGYAHCEWFDKVPDAGADAVVPEPDASTPDVAMPDAMQEPDTTPDLVPDAATPDVAPDVSPDTTPDVTVPVDVAIPDAPPPPTTGTPDKSRPAGVYVVPVAPPSAAPPEPYAGCVGDPDGVTYDVNPTVPAGGAEVAGGTLRVQSLGAVPWHRLMPGATVRIHWFDGAYREHQLLSTRGTAEHPITICGVLGPNGEFPVVSGQEAVTSANSHWGSYLPLQQAGFVVARDRDSVYGYRPGYLVFKGFEIRDWYETSTHILTDGQRATGSGKAAVSLIGTDHVTFERMRFRDSNRGIFTLSKAEVEGTLVRETLITGNEFFNCGSATTDRDHAVYAQGAGTVYQYNHFYAMRPPAGATISSRGAHLKDRSSGTIVRYNWFSKGSVRYLDLVEPQDWQAVALVDARFKHAYVYGNVFEIGPGDASTPIHYGGDSGLYQNYRRNTTLHLYHNTFVITAPRTGTGKITGVVLAGVDTDPTTPADTFVDFRNNVVWQPALPGGVLGSTVGLMGRLGTITYGRNAMPAGWVNGSTTATYVGDPATMTTTAPGLDPATFAPLPDSPVRLQAPPLGDLPPVTHVYVAPAGGDTRFVSTSLGALE